MASGGEGDCHKDPNFAVVCSFLDKYGASLGLEPISYSDLQNYLEDTTGDVSRVLIDIHVRLLRRIGKSIVNSDRFEKSIIKFCHHFSEFDAWEVESYGYRHAQLATKLRILKNLLECQFDYNLKFKEKINGQSAEEMRFIPIGRDKEGQAYWYFLDHDMNLLVYKEEQDDAEADTWKLVCRNRRELASLVSRLQDVKEQPEDKASTCDSRSSKEGTPDKDVKTEDGDVKDTKLTQEQTVNVKKEETATEQIWGFVKDKKIVCHQGEAGMDNKGAENQAEVVKKEKTGKEQVGMKEGTARRQLVVVLKRGKAAQEQEVDVKNEKVVQEVDVKKKKACLEEDMNVEKEGKADKEQEMDLGNDEKTDERQEIVGKSKKANQEQKLDFVKGKKSQMAQEIDIVDEGKRKEKQSLTVSKEGKLDKETEAVKINRSDKELEMDGGKVVKAFQKQESKVVKEEKANLNQVDDVAKKKVNVSTTDSNKSTINPLSDVDATTPMSDSEKGRSTDDHCEDLPYQHLEMAAEKNCSSDSTKQSSHCEDGTPPGGDKLPVHGKNEDDLEEDSSADVKKTASMQHGSGCVSQANNCKVPSLSDKNNLVKDIPSKICSNESPGMEDHLPETQNTSSEDGVVNLTSAVELKKADKETTRVEVTKEEKIKGTSDKKLSEEGKTEVSPVDEMGQNEEKASTNVEINEDKEKVISDAEENKEKLNTVSEEEKQKVILDSESNKERVISHTKDINEKVISDSEEIKEKVILDSEESKEKVISNSVEIEEKVILDSEEIKEKVISDSEEIKEKVILDSAEIKEKVISDSEEIKEKVISDSEEINEKVISVSEEKEKVISDYEESKKVKSDSEEIKEKVIANSEEIKKVKSDSEEIKEKAISDSEEFKEKVMSDSKENKEKVMSDSKEIKEKVISDSEETEKVISNSEETEKVISDSETNKGIEKVALNVNICQEVESEVASLIEVNRHERSVASDVLMNEKDVKTIELKEERTKVKPDNEVNQDMVTVKEVEVDQENTKETSEDKDMQIDKTAGTTDDEVSQDETTATDAVMEQEDSKTTDGDVNIIKATVSSKVKVCQVDETTEVTLDGKEKANTSLDAKLNKEEQKETPRDMESHCDDLSKRKHCTYESVVTPDVCKEKDSQLASSSVDLLVSNYSSVVVADNCDVLSVSAVVSSAEDLQDKSEDLNKSKTSLKFGSEFSCRIENTQTSCKDTDNKTDTSIRCQQKEASSVCSVNCASSNSTEDTCREVEDQDKVNIIGSKVLDLSCDSAPTQSTDTNKDVNNIQSSSGTDGKLECLEKAKLQKKPRKERKKKKTQLSRDKITLKADNFPGNDLSLRKENNVESDNVSLNKKEKEDSVGNDDNRCGQLVNGHSKENDSTPVVDTDISETGAAQLQCDNDKIECDMSKNNGNAEQNGLPGEEVKAVDDDTPSNSKKAAENKTSKSQIQSRRQLKRAVPEPASDDPVDSEPNGKRARQATKTQKTRRGRNAAVQGRAIMLASKDTESEDSETPLSQVRVRGQRLVGGSNCRVTRGRASLINQADKPKQESAVNDEGEEGISGKRGKKKKPDSSSEALSEEEVTPAKKGRNQTQSLNTKKGKNLNKAKAGNVKKPIAKPASAPVAEEDAGGVRRSMRVRQLRARRPPTPSSPSEETEETSDDEDSSEEEEDQDKNFLDASFTPEEEESGDEDFRPKGRNFQRQAARTSQEVTEEVVNDDTPCVKCGKYNHPEMILLCDKCDAGYHTACLRPPLMLIPDGDWFCPPCEHSRLVQKLLECLQSFDVSMKKKDRLSKRQERLAFVGISISNILHGGRKMTPQQAKSETHGRHDYLNEDTKTGVETGIKQEGSANSSSNESEPDSKITYRSERLAMRQAQKRSFRDKHKSSRQRHKRSPEVEVLSQRACRTRAAVSYQFKEFDELISSAIEDDKPYRREKPPGISRGKDMSNILGASDEEDEKIRQRDGDTSIPPPVVRKKTKRRLTRLDSDEEPDEDETDEFQISENDDSDATECEGDDAENEEVGSSDSGDWRPQKTWYNSHTSSRRSNRKLTNFVVEDDDYNSDENANKRRSTRNSNRGRIHYSDWDSNDEETEAEDSSDNSLYAGRKSQKQRTFQAKRKVAPGKKKAKHSDNSDSDSSITIRRKNLRKLIKKRRKDASESEDSQKESESIIKDMKKKKQGEKDSEESDFVLDEESQDDSDDSPKFKKKNVLRSSDEDGEDEQEHSNSGADSKPVAQETETSQNADSTDQVETVSKADDVPQVEEIHVPAPVEEPQKETVVKSKPKVTLKGKKRNDRQAEDKVAVPVTDVAVPGKVRKVSSSDRESDTITEMSSESPAPVVRAASEENNKQEDKINSEDVEESERIPQDQKLSSLAGGKGHEAPQPTDKVSSSGKKKTVPNFLDVNSGEESDEQKHDPHKDAAVPPYIADITASVQNTAPQQSSTDSSHARVDHPENQPQYRNFPHQGQHYPFNVRPYNNSAHGGPPYPQHQAMVTPQNLAPVRHDTGPPTHNSSIPNPTAHNGPPGLIQAFPDSMAQHPNSGQGNTVAPGVRGPPPFIGRGPRPSSGHPYPQNLGQSSPQSMEHGQNLPNIKQEHHISHPGYQGIPVSHHAPPGPTSGHVRPGMVQQHCGGMQPFFMGQQPHARPNMEGDPGANMGGYIPPNYGSRRMPSAQEMAGSGIRNPYFGMQSSPPHSMGHHIVRQFPGNMGSGPHMSSPLTSMGQMTRNLGSATNMHSPPGTQTMGGCEERRSSLGSPPNQESVQRQEKISEVREIKTECDMDDSPDKRKTGKKRTASSKSKKKPSEPNAQSPGLNQHAKQGPHISDEAKDRMPEPGQIIGGYRGPGQPYHMPPYQMPYSHGSMTNVNQQPGGQTSYMNPRHTPPVLAQQGPNADGNSTHSKDGEVKWSRTDSTETQPSNMPNMSPVDQRLKASPYQQNPHKTQPKGQAVPSLERRHSQSPVHQSSDAPAVNHSQEPPSAKPINMRTQEAGMESSPHTQIPAAHSSEISPNWHDGSSRSMASGQPMAPSTQDHNIPANSHRHNLPPYTQGSGATEPPGPYYNAGPYSSPYGPNQPMPQNRAWGPDMQGYGPRYGPHMYPYVMNPTNPGNRMPSGKPLYGSHGPTGLDLADTHTKGSAAPQDPCIKQEPGKKPKGGEQQGPSVNRRTSSSEYQILKATEPGHMYPKNLEQDIKPFRRNSEMEGENLSMTGTQRSQPLSEPITSLSSSLATTSPSASTHTVSHVSDGTTATSVSKQSSSTEQSSFQHSTSSNMNQSHQVPPCTSMAPRSTWSRPNTAVPYAHQHMGQWPNMGSPGHYGMARPYGGPGSATRSPYGMDPQAGPMRPNPGHTDQKPFMYQAYDLRFQSSHPGVGPGGSDPEYHRSGYNQEYPPPPQGRFPQQYQSCIRSQDGSSHQQGHAGADQTTEGSTVSKPKRAKTQKKTGKDGSGPVRGKSGRGRGRGRGGFMIDNLLQAQGGDIEDEQGEDSVEINDIVSYVTTDEYFKQQTGSGNFPRQAEVGLAGEKK